ncbi:MAG: hypothetical protein CSYNP_04371 [Syntrophus sp. SKADARSKE-3]|nr:hypothetical protein [Syntrophus sp. SKADARSKE-3]
MGIIISNTGPIIALAGIKRLDILKDLNDSVIIPEPVHIEIMAGGKSFVGIDEYKKATWMDIRKLKHPPEPLLAKLLDEGEASVIHLAWELGLEKILMDERKGRRIARDVYGLYVTGTIRLLIDAKRVGLIVNLADVLAEMKSSGYWIHDKIMQAAVKEVGE